LIRQDGVENPYLVSEKKDKQENNLIYVFIYTLYTPSPIDNNYSGDKEPPIRRLDNNNDLDINLVNTNNRDTKPK
jgi:hypothetical protein